MNFIWSDLANIFLIFHSVFIDNLRNLNVRGLAPTALGTSVRLTDGSERSGAVLYILFTFTGRRPLSLFIFGREGGGEGCIRGYIGSTFSLVLLQWCVGTKEKVFFLPITARLLQFNVFFYPKFSLNTENSFL